MNTKLRSTKNIRKSLLILLFILISALSFSGEKNEIKKILIDKNNELNTRLEKYRKSIDVKDAEKQKQEIRKYLKESIKKITEYIIAPPLEDVKETRDAIIFLLDKIDEMRINFGEFLTIDEKDEIKEMSQKIRTIIQSGINKTNLKKETVYAREEKIVDESAGVDKITYIKILMENDRYQDAYENLKKLMNYSNEIELLSLKAECLDKLGRYDEAAKEYENILLKQYSEEVEIKLIKIYIKLDKKYREKAKNELVRIINESKDEELNKSARKVYTQIRRDDYWKELKPRTEVGVGIIYDDNINLAKNDSENRVAAEGINAYFQVENDFILGDAFTIHPLVKYDRKDYANQNTEAFTLGVTPLIILENYNLYIPYNYYKLIGKAGVNEINSIGIKAGYYLNEYLSFEPSYEYQLTNRISNYKTNVSTFEFDAKYQDKKENKLGVGMRYSVENPREESEGDLFRGNRSAAIFVSGSLNLVKDVRIFGSSSFQQMNFNEAEPPETVVRDEQKLSSEIGIEKSEYFGLIKYRLGYKFEENSSSVLSYNYTNHKVELKIISEF